MQKAGRRLLTLTDASGEVLGIRAHARAIRNGGGRSLCRGIPEDGTCSIDLGRKWPAISSVRCLRALGWTQAPQTALPTSYLAPRLYGRLLSLGAPRAGWGVRATVRQALH